MTSSSRRRLASSRSSGRTWSFPSVTDSSRPSRGTGVLAAAIRPPPPPSDPSAGRSRPSPVLAGAAARRPAAGRPGAHQGIGQPEQLLVPARPSGWATSGRPPGSIPAGARSTAPAPPPATARGHRPSAHAFGPHRSDTAPGSSAARPGTRLPNRRGTGRGSDALQQRLLDQVPSLQLTLELGTDLEPGQKQQVVAERFQGPHRDDLLGCRETSVYRERRMKWRTSCKDGRNCSWPLPDRSPVGVAPTAAHSLTIASSTSSSETVANVLA